jgi:hypothetical protein
VPSIARSNAQISSTVQTISFFKLAENSPMKRLLVLATILGGFAGMAVAGNLPETLGPQHRAEFAGSTQAGCIDKQTHDPVNQQYGFSLDQITRYCSCISVELSNAITVEDFRYYQTTKQLSEPMLDQMFSFAHACAIQTINTPR